MAKIGEGSLAAMGRLGLKKNSGTLSIHRKRAWPIPKSAFIERNARRNRQCTRWCGRWTRTGNPDAG